MTAIAVTTGQCHDGPHPIRSHRRGGRLMLTPEEAAARGAVGRRFSEALLEALDRMARLPDVAAVGLSSSLPLAGGIMSPRSARVVGRPAPSDPNASPQVWLRSASPGYFDVMRLRLRGGRFFTALTGPTARALRGQPDVRARHRRRARRRSASRDRRRRRPVGSDRGGGGHPVQEPQGVRAACRGVRVDAPDVRRRFKPSVHVARTTGDPLAVIPFLSEAVAEAHPARRSMT